MGSFREIDPAQFARHFLNVPYADEDPRQMMDIWLPNEGEGPFPLSCSCTVVVVSGNKRENTMPEYSSSLQDMPLPASSTAWFPDVHWPGTARRCSRGDSLLRAHAAEHNLNAENIAIGGQFCRWASCSHGGVALAGRPVMNEGRYGNLDQSDAVQCLAAVYTPTDMYQLDLCDRTTAEDQAAATDGNTVRAIQAKRAWAKCQSA